MNRIDRYKAESAISRVLIIAVIVLLLFITLFPFFWVIRTSFTPHNLILRCPTCRINTTIIDHRQCINADICEQPCYVKKCSFDNFDKFKTRQRDRIKSILINEWRDFRGLNFIGRMF